MSTSEIILSVSGTVLAVLGYLLKSKVDRIEMDIYENRNDIKKVSEENKEIKDNYLSRFEQINKNISDSKIEIIKELAKLASKIHGQSN